MGNTNQSASLEESKHEQEDDEGDVTFVTEDSSREVTLLSGSQSSILIQQQA